MTDGVFMEIGMQIQDGKVVFSFVYWYSLLNLNGIQVTEYSQINI